MLSEQTIGSRITLFTILFTGLYLFLQVEAPLQVEVVKLRHYLFIGWGK